MVKQHRRLGILLCVMAFVLWCAAGTLFTAMAADSTGTLTIWCVKDDDKIHGMHWQIYRVGHREKDDYVFEGEYAGYRPTLGDKTKPMLEWDTDTVVSAGETLKAFLIADKRKPIADGETDAQGCVSFSGLENGLYLVWGDILKDGDTTYIPAAIFFEMSSQDVSVLNAYPKIVLHTKNESKANFSVRKVWENDEDQPWNRSVSITVERYRDNAYYDEIVLSDANAWTYEWEDTTDHAWFVHEKIIPEDYTVAYKENHTQYLIVNTYAPTKDGSATDIQTTAVTDNEAHDIQTTAAVETQNSDVQTTANHAAETTDTVSSGSTAEMRSSTQTTTTTTTQTVTTPSSSISEEKMPQTGQLWWPIPFLCTGGAVLLGIGLRIGKKDHTE